MEFVPISDVESAEIGKTSSDRTAVWCGTRLLPGGSVEIVCSKAEHFDWLAEQISSMCGICVEFRLCSADPAELDKACSDRISVRWEGRTLLGEPIDILCATVDDFDRPAEKILSKCGICIEFRLCSVNPAEIGKTCSDRTYLWWERRTLSGGPSGIFDSAAEDSVGRAE